MNATYPTARPPGDPFPERGIAHARTAALLDLDPDLGAHLDPARFASARGALSVRVVALPRGEWAGSALTSISPENVGLLLIDGVVGREVVLEDTVSTELLGPGDLIRPWSAAADPDLLQRQVRWQVLADARLAVLGRPFGSALPRFPEVNAALLDRACARSDRLATMQAIAHLNSVERRVIALFWHLAERWGRVIGDGVVVPLTLSHRLLGELIGARRPTVSAAIAALERAGRLARRPDATWLLLGERPGTSGQPTGRLVLHRRRLLCGPPAVPAGSG